MSISARRISLSDKRRLDIFVDSQSKRLTQPHAPRAIAKMKPRCKAKTLREKVHTHSSAQKSRLVRRRLLKTGASWSPSDKKWDETENDSSSVFYSTFTDSQLCFSQTNNESLRWWENELIKRTFVISVLGKMSKHRSAAIKSRV